MSFEARCPQCLFVSRQLGQPTPCLLHVSLSAEVVGATGAQPDVEPTLAAPATEYDEPYAFGQRRPTVDRPGPFTLREYVRLQLLRSRVESSASALDQATDGAQARSLSHR